MVPAQAIPAAQAGVPKGWLEEKDAAPVVHLRPSTLVTYRKRGIGPAYALLGRRVIYHPENLQAWMEAGGTRSTEEGPNVMLLKHGGVRSNEAPVAERHQARKLVQTRDTVRPQNRAPTLKPEPPTESEPLTKNVVKTKSPGRRRALEGMR